MGAIDSTEALEVLYGSRRWTVLNGDCVDVLDRIPSSSIDAMVTDPPAGISFMGKEWDGDKGGRDSWIAWLASCMREAYRVLKPGAHGLVWALPRTSHWTAMALELAGFEIRDRIVHIFGEGFPKSLDMVKAAIEAGKPYPSDEPGAYALIDWMRENRSGFGTALKPSVEDWWLVRKPLSSTIIGTVREHGTGAINIDGCRVRHASAEDLDAHAAGVAAIKERGGTNQGWKSDSDLSGVSDVTELGRWPAHLVLSHGPDCKPVGERKVKGSRGWYATDRDPSSFTGPETSTVHHADEDGLETVTAWECADGCPAKLLDEQSGVSGKVGAPTVSSGIGGIGVPRLNGEPGKENTGVRSWGDEGGASRYFTQLPFDPEAGDFEPFFYTPKPARQEREDGCKHLPTANITGRKIGSAGTDSPRAGAGRKGLRHNHHPTVKSSALMRWLVRLVTPPNGAVVDLFAGSGSTGIACSAERLRFIGIELEPGYVDIANARIYADAPLLNFGGGR